MMRAIPVPVDNRQTVQRSTSDESMIPAAEKALWAGLLFWMFFAALSIIV